MWIFQFIVEYLFYILLDVVGYNVARFVIPLVSFGRIRVGPIIGDERQYRWFGGRSDGIWRMELGASAASQIGLAICAVCLVAYWSLMR